MALASKQCFSVLDRSLAETASFDVLGENSRILDSILSMFSFGMPAASLEHAISVDCEVNGGCRKVRFQDTAECWLYTPTPSSLCSSYSPSSHSEVSEANKEQ